MCCVVPSLHGGDQQVFLAPRTLAQREFPLQQAAISGRCTLPRTGSPLHHVRRATHRPTATSTRPIRTFRARSVPPSRRHARHLPHSIAHAYRVQFAFDTVEIDRPLTRGRTGPRRTSWSSCPSVTRDRSARCGSSRRRDCSFWMIRMICRSRTGFFLRFTVFPESMEHHVHLRYLSVLKFYTALTSSMTSKTNCSSSGTCSS
jgi:hypothetical protein